MDIPVLETPRLLLRGWQENDLYRLSELYADPMFTRYLGGDGSTRTVEDTWKTLSILAGHWCLRGFGMWLVETKAQQFVGVVGLKKPYGWPGTEIGWGISPKYWKQGYAFEASRAAINWGFSHLDIQELISVISPENIASQKLALKLGETYYTTQMIAGKQEFIYRITRQSYAALAL